MMREYTCILCPNGCRIRVELEEKEILSIEGFLCPRGKAYVEQELTCPLRNIATSVLVKGGILPLASVRLTQPIPKDSIFDAMTEIRKCTLTAPVESGTVLIRHVLGYDADVIVTKEIPAIKVIRKK